MDATDGVVEGVEACGGCDRSCSGIKLDEKPAIRHRQQNRVLNS